MADYSKVTWYDQVLDQNNNVIQAGTPLSASNMNRMESGIDLADNVVGVMVAETLQKVNSINKELDKWQNQRLQQGEVYIYNKAVISGAVINAMTNSRYIQISTNGTYTAGNVSLVNVDGKTAGIPDEQMVAMVPMNTVDSVADVYYAYLDYDAGQGRYRVFLNTVVPAGKLVLYKITVPVGDNKTDLSSVTITDQRRIESSSVYRATEPLVFVSVPGYTMLNVNDYDVELTVEAASDFMAVGEKIVYGKQANGFSIKITGTADNVQIRWTIVNPRIK